MPGFDTSNVAATVNSQPFDPLKTVTGLAELQNTYNQNKMFQAKNLAGQYLEQSTGPDGQPDFNKLSRFLANDPRTGPYAPELIQSAKSIQSTGVGTQRTQLDISQAQMQNARTLAAQGAATGLDPNGKITDQGRKSAAMNITRGVNSGVVSPEIGAQAMANLDDFIGSSLTSGAGGSDVDKLTFGAPATRDIGGAIQTVNERPQLGGPGTVTQAEGNAANLSKTLSASDLATPVDTVDEQTGERHRNTLNTFLDTNGAWKPGKSPPLIDAGPLNNAARTALGSAYGPQIANFETEVAAAPGTKQLIEQMRTSLGQFQTGPNSSFWQKMGELASEYGIKFDPNDVNKTSAAEVFTKIVPNLLRQQAVTLGMNETDTGRQIASTAIPTKDLTEAGINKMLGIIEGNTDAINAQGKVWQQQKDRFGPGTYGNFRMEFSQKVPPTIFQSQYMSPEEIKEMQKSWTPKQKATWDNQRLIAEQQGWLPNAK